MGVQAPISKKHGSGVTYQVGWVEWPVLVENDTPLKAPSMPATGSKPQTLAYLSLAFFPQFIHR